MMCAAMADTPPAADPHSPEIDPEDIPGGVLPRYMPPLRRAPRPAGEPTPRQARAVAVAGLVLTLVLGVLGAAGVAWAVVALVHR